MAAGTRNTGVAAFQVWRSRALRQHMPQVPDDRSLSTDTECTESFRLGEPHHSHEGPKRRDGRFGGEAYTQLYGGSSGRIANESASIISKRFDEPNEFDEMLNTSVTIRSMKTDMVAVKTEVGGL